MENKKEYKFDGDVKHFMGIMEWSLVALEMQKMNVENRFDVLTKPEEVERVAGEMGMTNIVLLKEISRLGKEADELLDFYDALDMRDLK